MNEIQRFEADNLTEMQKNIAPLVAMNVAYSKIASIYKIPVATISAWANTDRLFMGAVSQLREHSESVIKSYLNQAGVLAAQYAIERITDVLPETDVAGRRIQADMAKSVLTMISPKKTDVKLSVQTDKQENNIDEESALIVAQHAGIAKENPKTYVVIDDVKILEDEPIMYKDTNFGVLNMNTEDKTIQCHICGKWDADFVTHIRQEHKISPKRYRDMYRIDENVMFYVGE